MNLTFPGEKVIELGGGAAPRFHPNVDARMTDEKGQVLRDVNGIQAVDFTADFNKPLPIQNGEWDGVFCQYCLEHISYTKVRQFISEVFRILKPGGKAVFITANTEAQVEWILGHREGWDNEDFFTSASKKLFGGQDYGENSHKCFFNPVVLQELFSTAGFEDIFTSVYGARNTDLFLEVKKPVQSEAVQKEQEVITRSPSMIERNNTALPAVVGLLPTDVRQPKPVDVPKYEAAKLFDRDYFDGGLRVGGYAPPGYRDFPCHEITARHVLSRKPKSVLELGCGRGYVLKRLQDSIIGKVHGFDVSKHCHMSRACNGVYITELCEHFPTSGEYDLCFSISFLEHIPEEYISKMMENIQKVSKRGLHGVSTKTDGFDKTKVTVKPLDWWRAIVPQGHEILDSRNLEQGPLPIDYLQGDGKVKVSVGGFTTMFHHGWVNIDSFDLSQFAQENSYNYRRHDYKKELPFPSSSVDLIFLPMVLQRHPYNEVRSILKECRRILTPTGVMRVIVPHAEYLMSLYSNSEEEKINSFSHINGTVETASSLIEKLHCLLYSGNSSIFDPSSLCQFLQESKFDPQLFTEFEGNEQILAETIDVYPSLGLYVEATPSVK